MTLLIEVEPEIERALQQRAQLKGVALSDLLRVLVEREAHSGEAGTATSVPAGPRQDATEPEQVFEQRLAAIRQFTTGARQLTSHFERLTPAAGHTWSRQEIYEGLEDRFLAPAGRHSSGDKAQG